MRRKDKEIKDKKEIEMILNKAQVCRIALSNNNIPYIVPVNFGYIDNCLYIHSATEGKKIELIKKNNNVCFEMDINHEILEEKSPCHTTTKYCSIIGYGKAYFITDPDEIISALNIIVEHYLPDIPHEYSEKSLKRILIIKIEIDTMTGKISGY